MQTDTDPQAPPSPAADALSPAPLPDEPYYQRSNQARTWGSVLLLIGLVWLVFALGSRVPLVSVGFVEQSVTTGAQSLTATRVVVTGGPDNVAIFSAEGDAVQIDAVKYGFGWSDGAALDALNQLEVDFRPSGDTLYVEVRRPLGTVIGRAPFADLRIALPPGVTLEASVVSGEIVVAAAASDLTLSTVSGDVDVEGTTGRLTLSTTSGDLAVRDHRGPLSAESVIGDVQIDGDLASPRVETVSGDASVAGASGSVELSSISGELSLDGAALDALRIESTSGDIEASISLAPSATGSISNISGDVQVRLAGPPDLGLDATTASGEINSDLPGFDTERRSLRGTLGAGEATLTISTVSGDIAVEGE